MRFSRSKGAARGVLAFDLIAGISLVILVLAGFGLAANRLASIQKHTAMQRQVRDAAACALNCIRAGIPDPQEVLRHSGPTFAGQIELRITREPGGGDWNGATRIRVEAILDRGAQPAIREVLCAYVYEPEGGS
jgi:hypothetical protein